MSHPFLSKLKSKTGIGILLLLLVLVLFPLIHYYFANFYFSSREDFKSWYPRLHFIIYPVVKASPFVFLLLLAWLLHQAVWRLIQRLFTRLKQVDSPQVVKTLLSKGKQLMINLSVLLISTLVILVITEFTLRKIGMKPGYRMYTAYFTPVDSLYNMNGFAADSDGIFHISSDARDFICEELRTKNAPEELLPLSKLQSREVYALSKDFLALRKPDYTSDFKTFLESLDAVTEPSDSEFVHAVRNYVRCPINSKGFKSIEFKRYPSKRKSILLLGDSFTWGHSSPNKTNCFADVLLTKGYVVYNSGITGTDVTQYLQVAKTWIPILKPDYVVVNFYMGNDIVFFERKPKPYFPVFFTTNAGNLVTCPEGVYFDNAQEAYQHTLAVFTIPAGNNAVNRFCSKTVVGTLLWRVGAKFNFFNSMPLEYKDYYIKVQAAATKTPYSDVQLSQIKTLTGQYGGNFLLVAIPLLDGKKFIFPRDKQPLFTGLEYFVPPVTIKDYEEKEDGHYNELGHKMHAEFIDSLIKNGAGKP